MNAALATAVLALACSVRAQDGESTFDLDAALAAVIPAAEDARWTLVPWRESLTDALEESRRVGKPVYLYVNDGDVASGRC